MPEPSRSDHYRSCLRSHLDCFGLFIFRWSRSRPTRGQRPYNPCRPVCSFAGLDGAAMDVKCLITLRGMSSHPLPSEKHR